MSNQRKIAALAKKLEKFDEVLEKLRVVFQNNDGKIDETESAQITKIEEYIHKCRTRLRIPSTAPVAQVTPAVAEGGDATSTHEEMHASNETEETIGGDDTSGAEAGGNSDAPATPGGEVMPPWIREAYKHKGVTETAPMVRDDAFVKMLFEDQGLYDSWASTQTVNDANWCAAFVSYCLRKAGESALEGFDGIRALKYADYGTRVDRMVYGAIAVVKRGGGGHVGFVVGKEGDSIIMLGGNQGNAVSEKVESRELVAYVVPSNWTIPEQNYLS